MMNQISQWSFQHPILAVLIAYLVIAVIIAQKIQNAIQYQLTMDGMNINV